MVKEAESKLRALGRPVWVGITGRSFPYTPFPNGGGVLRDFVRVKGGMVWYRSFQTEEGQVVVFATEPLG